MTAPAESYIQLPDDAGNSGKKIHTATKLVGANTVHEHFYVSARKAKVLGVYKAAMTQQAVLAAAQNGTTTGFLWGHVPTAVSGKAARLRRMRIQSQLGSALATPTAPRIALSRFTFTGTASGATVAPSQVDSTAPAPILDLRTAITGLTPALGARVGAAAIVGALTAVGAWNPAEERLADSLDEDEWDVFLPGQGFVAWQDTIGTASDTRVFNLNMVWDEVDVS